MSGRVSHFNQDWNSKDDFDADKQFKKAQQLVGNEFLDKLFYYSTVWLPGREIVSDMIKKRFAVHESGEILEMETFCPWKQHLSELEQEHEIVGVPKFVIYTDTNGNYRVICVPIKPESFVCRKFLHKGKLRLGFFHISYYLSSYICLFWFDLILDWRGLRDEELQKISKIEDASFCHATGFIGGANTRDGALTMAIESLEYVESSAK